MAAGADSRHGQAAQEKAVTMNGLRVIGEDLVLADGTKLRNGSPLFMTRTTKIRYIHNVRGGILVG